MGCTSGTSEIITPDESVSLSQLKGYGSGLYANICKKRPSSYFTYTNFEPNWQNGKNYELCSKLGSGKYSDVYLGCHMKSNQKCAFKILMPENRDKHYRIRRETKIL